MGRVAVLAVLMFGCGAPAATDVEQRGASTERLRVGAYYVLWPDAGELGALTIESTGRGWWGVPVCLPADQRVTGCAYYALNGEVRAAGMDLELRTDGTSYAGTWRAQLRIAREEPDAGVLILDGQLTGPAAPGVPGTITLELQR